jgi:hypothetical protein
MDKQEIFNTVYLGLASQGFKRSINTEAVRCMYRGDEGRKCAAGWLIPDNEYDPAIENEGIVIYVDYFKNKYDPNTLYFIKDLQESHDWFDTPEMVKESLIRRAEHHGLTVPEIPNV